METFKKARDEAIQILKQQVRQANTAREALKRDGSYTNASDDEKTGNSVAQLKSIIEHQKESLRKIKREMCLADEKQNLLTEGKLSYQVLAIVEHSLYKTPRLVHMCGRSQ